MTSSAKAALVNRIQLCVAIGCISFGWFYEPRSWPNYAIIVISGLALIDSIIWSIQRRSA